MDGAEHRLPRAAQRAFQLGLELPEVELPRRLHHLIAADRIRIAARPAGDPQRAFEADEIGGRADMLGGHHAGICGVVESSKNEKGTQKTLAVATPGHMTWLC